MMQSTPDSIYYPRYTAWARDARYLKMKRTYGHEGVGILSELMDYLREQDLYRATTDSIPEVAYLLRGQELIVRAVILESELFVIEDGYFSCPMLSAALWPLDEKRRKLSEAGQLGNRKRWPSPSPPDPNPIQTTSPPDQVPIASIVEKSKEQKNIVEENLVEKEFELFWEGYDKKVGRKKATQAWFKLSAEDRQKVFTHYPGYVKATQAWFKLSAEDRQKVFTHYPGYVKAKPDKVYRKDPERYLKDKSFEDEIIIDSKAGANQPGVVKQLTGGTSDARINQARDW